MEPLLKVEKLEKRYLRKAPFQAGREVAALAGVSCEVAPQKTLALVGESGSGKSTLALCIACLERATSGEIWFEGKEIAALSEKELRAIRPQIQLVFQDPASSLNPRLTVMEIVTEPLDVQGFTKGESGARCRQLLERVGLAQKIALQRPDELSGGQRQRVALARALALRPKLLIFDEALSALDCSIQAQVANLLLDLQAAMGLTYVFITHDFRMAAHMGDEIAVMDGGQIVERGPAEKIFRAPQHPATQRMVQAAPELGGAARVPGAP